MAVPLTDEDGSIGALLVSSGRPEAWSESDASLLTTIADQASITIRTTRLIAELDRSRDALARRAGAERTLREIAARVTVLREPDEILQDVIEAGRPPASGRRRDARPAQPSEQGSAAHARLARSPSPRWPPSWSASPASTTR